MDMDQAKLEQLVREILGSMGNNTSSTPKTTGGIDASQYPLGIKRKDLVKTPTNKSLDDLTLESVMNGNTTIEDVKITPEVLELQAQVAESAGRPTIARNFRRAGELTRIPDARILEIYNALRPFRSTKAELLEIADEIETKYNAKVNAAFIREAAYVYEKRRKLRDSE